MGKVQRDERRLRRKRTVQEDGFRGFGIALLQQYLSAMTLPPPLAKKKIQTKKQSIYLTYVEIKLRPPRPIPKPLPLPLDMPHRRIRKSAPDRPTHDAQSPDMPHQLRERSKQQRHVRQRPRGDHPRRIRRLLDQRMPHSQHGVCLTHGR